MIKVNDGMSYSEVRTALDWAVRNNIALTQHQLICILISLLDNPFSRNLLIFYPYPKILRDFLESEVAKQPSSSIIASFSLQLHEAFYAKLRLRTEKYLRTHYPSVQHLNLSDCLKDFIDELLSHPEAEKLLQDAEKRRYNIRKHKKDLASPELPLQEIKTNLKNYTQSLLTKARFNFASNRAKSVLNSVLQRIKKQHDPVKQQAAKLLLLTAIDEASASIYSDNADYWDILKNHLLEEHCFLAQQKNDFADDTDAIGHFAMSITSPFVCSDNQMCEEQKPYAPSKILCEIYRRAAGYEFQSQTLERYKLQGDLTLSEVDVLYAEWSSETQYCCDVTRLLHLASPEFLENYYPDAIKFLKDRALIKIEETREMRLIAPLSPKDDQEIMSSMIEEGPFIDKAHLELVLSIQGESGGLTDLKSALDSTLNGDFISVPQRNDMMTLYSDFLSRYRVYWPFYHQDFFRRSSLELDFFKPIKSCESVLCQWLEQDINQIPVGSIPTFANWCAEKGYDKAITILSLRFSSSIPYNQLLHAAGHRGHTDVVNVLLQNGADINLPDSSGVTLLEYAAKRDLIDIINLIKNNTLNSDSGDALLSAASMGSTSAVKLLLKNGARVNYQNSSLMTALMQAAYYGHTDIAQMLLNYGADIDTQDINGKTALYHAVRSDKHIMVKFLIANGANLDLQDATGQTALIFAASFKKNDLAKILLENKANVHLKDNNGNDALYWAVSQENSSLTESLLNYGAEPGISLLRRAITRQHYEIAQQLIKYGACSEQHYAPDHDTILIYAIRQGHMPLINLILKTGVAINSPGAYGWTALITATSRDNVDLVKILLDYGANFDAQDNYGKTALSVAVINHNINIIELLIKHGARINTAKRTQQDAIIAADIDIMKLLIAKYGCNVDLFSLLKERGVWIALKIALIFLAQSFNFIVKKLSLDKTSNEQKLRKAMTTNNISEIQQILSSGKIHINCLTEDNQSIIDLALQSGNPALIKLILNHSELSPWLVIKALQKNVGNAHFDQEFLPVFLSVKRFSQILENNKESFLDSQWEILSHRLTNLITEAPTTPVLSFQRAHTHDAGRSLSLKL